MLQGQEVGNGKPQFGREEGGSNQKAQGSRQESGKNSEIDGRNRVGDQAGHWRAYAPSLVLARVGSCQFCSAPRRVIRPHLTVIGDGPGLAQAR